MAPVQESPLDQMVGRLTGSSLNALGEVVREVRPRLNLVEDLIQRHLASSSPTIQAAGAHVFEAGGKRLRPAVLLAVARAIGYEGDNDVRYAASVEIIHTASLVHDDVIDHAAVRRRRATLNSLSGNQFAVLLGDWLYTRGMEIALEDDHLLPLRILSRATTSLTEGEILALGLQGRSDITFDQYQQVCELKTAELFAAAASIPATFDPAQARFREPLRAYGHHLGLCFQIIDDLLDVTASEKRLGKPVFSDLREGRLTLPFILALPDLPAEERQMVETVLGGGEMDDQAPRRLRRALDRQGALDAARQIAHEHAELAAAAISGLPASSTRRALQGAPLALLDRKF